MLQPFDQEIHAAYEQILALPDPPELAKRGQVHRFDGDPDRRDKILLGLVVTWLQRRHLTADGQAL